MPGMLPVVNRRVVDFGMKAGMMLNCHINRVTTFDKKSYYYPDLPAAYQTTQWFAPVAVNGTVEIDTPTGYLSINDSIGDIWDTFKGKLVLLGVVSGLLKKMKSKDGGSKEVAGFSTEGMKISPKMINKNTIGMLKGFSIKRVCMMAKSLFTKEELLEINAKLNKIKKASK
jgi:hypothetical protein